MGVTLVAARRGRIALLVLVAAAVAAVALPGGSTAATDRAKGLDVSHWNGVIDWIRVAGDGYTFIFGKATEGFTLIDPTYSVNRAGTEGLGMRFGAYHFARPSGTSDAAATASAIQQADHLVDVAAPQANELPPVLDLETTGGLKPQRLQLWARAWLDEVYARIGVQGLIYASPLFWQRAVGNSVDFATAGNRLWIAHWTKKAAPLVPAGNWGGQGWTFWQWTNCSTVPGFAHCSDGDRMNGPDPSTVAIGAYPTGMPAVVDAPHVVGGAATGKALAAVPGTWSGGKPVRFSYQWQQCDAAGAGCQPISGAVNEKYVPAAADVGHSLVALVTATTDVGSAVAASTPTAAVAAAGKAPSVRPVALTQPQVSGLSQVGQSLTTDVGAWSGSPTGFSYQWQRCDPAGAGCVAISGATGSSYTLTPDDIGATLSVLVGATGAGGTAAVTTAPTGQVVAAPLPTAVPGSLTAQPGQAGNVQMEDGRASVTWQPGAVPDGLTMILAPFTDTLSVPGTQIALGVAGLGPGGFRWPVDISYTAPQPARTVLGYSTDAMIYSPVPALSSPPLPAGNTIGSYVRDGILHVLTRIPVRLALFQQGQWGDPTRTSVEGPALAQLTPVKLLKRKDKSVLMLTRLSTKSQVLLFATVFGPGHSRLAILGKGSMVGQWLKAGTAPKTARTQKLKSGGIPVRLRLNGRFLKHGTRYRVRVVALDPWGRSDAIVLPFKYP